jgi:hypothetical protein
LIVCTISSEQISANSSRKISSRLRKAPSELQRFETLRDAERDFSDEKAAAAQAAARAPPLAPLRGVLGVRMPCDDNLSMTPMWNGKRRPATENEKPNGDSIKGLKRR